MATATSEPLPHRTILTLADLRKVDQMTEPSLAETVAAFEARQEADADTIKALRAANGGLEAMTNAIHAVLNEHEGDEAVSRIREVLYGAALKDKP